MTTPRAQQESTQFAEKPRLLCKLTQTCAAMKRLKRNKAAGVDGIGAEFVLDASDISLNARVMTSNRVPQRGVPAPCQIWLLRLCRCPTAIL